MKTRFIRNMALSLISASAIGSTNAFAQTEATETTESVTAETTAPVETSSGWEICNETSYELRLATATVIEGEINPRGWSSLRAGSCMAVAAQFGAPRFVYAESAPVHRGGIREWTGEIPLCAGDEDFEADPGVDCALQELSTRKYIAVDPEETVTTLVEIEDFGGKAVTAGIQRLLMDNGYEITRVDGVAGRRTSKTLAAFLKDQGLPVSLTPEEQLDALAKASAEKIKSVGLTLCNSSTSEIWAAIGRRRKGNWESRGWWSIPTEGCAQVFTDSLISADLSYYAVQAGGIDENGAKTGDKPLKSLAATPSQFCIADSLFAVMGRENCADHGYLAANFRPLPIDKEGAKVELSDADFVATTASGLRR